MSPHRKGSTSSHHSPTVVVVGAGFGGLSAALTLAASGIRTTLLEQHHTVGGKAHQTAVGPALINSGPTVFTLRAVFDDLFNAAGKELNDYIQPTKLDLLARHFWQDSPALDLFSDVDRTCQAIEAFSNTNEADRYRKFAKRSESLFEALNKTFMQVERPSLIGLAGTASLHQLATIVGSSPFTSLYNSMAKTFKDPRLAQLFSRYSTYCGSSPFKAPATLMLIAHAERAGVWTLQGGLTELANAIAQVFGETGGELLLNTRIEEITCKDNKIQTVITADGQQIKADAVIFNGDIAALTSGLLGTDLKAKVRQRKQQKSLSAVTLSCTAPVHHPELAHHNVFFSTDYKDEFDSIYHRGDISIDPTLYLCAQDRIDNQPTKQPSEGLFALINAPAAALSAEKKEIAADCLRKKLVVHGVLQHDSHEEGVYAYPDTFANRFPASNGALYGQPVHTATGSFSRHGSRTTVQGLYVAGASVHPGAGVPMVSLSGQIAARAVLNDFAIT